MGTQTAQQIVGGAPKGKAHVTKKVQAFLEVLRTKPGISRAEAARLAGYGDARTRAAGIVRKHPQLVAEAEAQALRNLKLSAEEAEQIAADIARDPTHRDRLKAIEMFLKMHGKLSDKLQVTVDRAQLTKQLDELIAGMAAARQAEQLLNPLQEPAPNNPQPTVEKPQES